MQELTEPLSPPHLETPCCEVGCEVGCKGKDGSKGGTVKGSVTSDPLCCWGDSAAVLKKIKMTVKTSWTMTCMTWTTPDEPQESGMSASMDVGIGAATTTAVSAEAATMSISNLYSRSSAFVQLDRMSTRHQKMAKRTPEGIYRIRLRSSRSCLCVQ